MTPQTILILLCAAEAVLLLIRLSIGGSGRRLRSPDVGSSMTIGGREVQEDFVGTLATQTGLVAVLADGMGKAYGARIASRTAVETFRLTIPSTISGNPSMRLTAPSCGSLAMRDTARPASAWR